MSYDQVTAMPQTIVDSALYCYGSLVTQGNWTGVQLSYLLTQVGIDPSVSSIELLAQDTYRVVIPIETATQSDVILAYQKDSASLNEVYRLVVPFTNGAVWIAQVISINMGTDVVSSPQSQSPALTDALRNSVIGNQPVLQPATPAPTPVHQIPSANPTQAPHNQITPDPTGQVANATETPQQPEITGEVTLYAIAAILVVVLVMAGISVYARKRA